MANPDPTAGTGVTVRAATASDIDAVVAVNRAAKLNPVPDRDATVSSAIRDGHGIVAELDGRVAGYATLDKFYGFAFIEMIAVTVESRRRGVGLALIRELGRISPTAKLFTSTNASNMRMQRLCDKAGFVPSGVIENLDDGDPELVFFKLVRTEAP